MNRLYDYINVLVTNWGPHASSPKRRLKAELGQYKITVHHPTHVVSFLSCTKGGKLDDSDVENIYTTLSRMGITVRRDS